jgi:ribonuclease III
MKPIEETLGHSFQKPELLEEALCHRSFVNEQGEEGMRDNERLEFLGDAVLNLIIGHLLMERFPLLAEGELSRTRANLVNESRLARIAAELSLGAHIRLGKGEQQSHGQQKKSILADALEAIIAAVYLDGGFPAAFSLVQRLFDRHLRPDRLPAGSGDPKSRLQERLQAEGGAPPTYRVVQESGPDHDKTFHVELTANGLSAEGCGKSKKAAEQDAARQALETMDELTADFDSR